MDHCVGHFIICVRISLAYVQTVILDEADQMLEQRLATRLQTAKLIAMNTPGVETMSIFIGQAAQIYPDNKMSFCGGNHH